MSEAKMRTLFFNDAASCSISCVFEETSATSLFRIRHPGHLPDQETNTDEQCLKNYRQSYDGLPIHDSYSCILILTCHY